MQSPIVPCVLVVLLLLAPAAWAQDDEERLAFSDEDAARLLVEHECGRIGEDAVGLALARRLSELTGAAVSGEGLVRRVR